MTGTRFSGPPIDVMIRADPVPQATHMSLPPSLPFAYRSGSSAAQLLDRCIARIDQRESTVRAWAALDLAAARNTALTLDREAAAGRFRSALHGMPLGIKDLFDTAGFATRAGSPTRADRPPAAADAEVVQRLRDAGCVIVGKTKTTEYAYLDPTDTTNPFDAGRTPGGSSSGSAAAVGAGMVPLALGTQTVGSVCRPAAYCGCAAFKPTTGSMSMTGVVPFSASFDTTGFIASSFELAVAAWRIAAGADAGGAAAVDAPPDLRGLRFVMLADDYFQRIDADVAGALQRVASVLAGAGALGESIRLDVDLESLRETQRVVMFKEAATAHADLFAQLDRLGAHWRAGLLFGRAVTAQQEARARDRLESITASVLDRLSAVDFVLLPPTHSVAPGRSSTGDPGLILPWTIFGTPLSVLPAGANAAGLPTAIMLAGHPSLDRQLAGITLALERAMNS